MKKTIGLFAVAALLAPALTFAAVDITLNGAHPHTVSVGSTYVDPGYSANSTVDGDITGSVSVSNVDTSKAGTTQRTYSVTDSALDSASVSRTIIVAGGGGQMLWCAGPNAPGWNNNIPGGGCPGRDEILVAAGATYTYKGKVDVCPWFYPAGCMVHTKE